MDLNILDLSVSLIDPLVSLVYLKSARSYMYMVNLLPLLNTTTHTGISVLWVVHMCSHIKESD